MSRTFDVIYTSGAGALLGLLYTAPKGKEPKEALRGLVELGVSDLIYKLVPIGYKTFFKPGPFTRPIRQLAQLFKIGSFPLPQIDRPVTGLGLAYNEWLKMWDTAQGGGIKRFYNDLIDLWAAAITPTPLHYWSKGVCDPLPFLEDLVDFHVLNEKSGPFHFYMNAFSVTERHHTLYAKRGAATQWGYRRAGFTTRPLPEFGTSKASRKKSALQSGYTTSEAQESDPPTSGLKMKLFYNKKGGGIHPEEVRAAFAYPFIYPPVTLNREVHFEGAGRDPISFGNLLVEDGVRADVKNIRGWSLSTSWEPSTNTCSESRATCWTRSRSDPGAGSCPRQEGDRTLSKRNRRSRRKPKRARQAHSGEPSTPDHASNAGRAHT